MALNFQNNSVKKIKFNQKDALKVQVRNSASEEFTPIYEIVTKTENVLFSGTTQPLAVLDSNGNTYYTTATLKQTLTDTTGEILEIIDTSVSGAMSESIWSGPTVNGNVIEIVLKSTKATTKAFATVSVTYKLIKT